LTIISCIIIIRKKDVTAGIKCWCKGQHHGNLYDIHMYILALGTYHSMYLDIYLQVNIHKYIHISKVEIYVKKAIIVTLPLLPEQ
jgi:hypothetical protein